jgi:hypothetical protein
MAVRNPRPILFLVKPGISEGGALEKHIHSLADVKPERNLYLFVCDSQPLLTITSCGRPKRCPLCRQHYPIGNDKLGSRPLSCWENDHDDQSL